MYIIMLHLWIMRDMKGVGNSMCHRNLGEETGTFRKHNVYRLNECRNHKIRHVFSIMHWICFFVEILVYRDKPKKKILRSG